MTGKGIWTQEEHDRFLHAIKIYPQGPWRALAKYIGSRSVRQVQTHAQKYHEKIQRRLRGLHKDRKTWARKEHRIDEELLDSCRFAEHMSGQSLVMRVHKAATSDDSASDDATGGMSFKELLEEATQESPRSPMAVEDVEPLAYDINDALVGKTTVKLEAGLDVDLPSFTESLDFFIEYLSD